MTKEERIRAEIAASIQKKLVDMYSGKAPTRDELIEVIQKDVRRFADLYGLPINTGIKAHDAPNLEGANQVPPDWELWCEGWTPRVRQTEDPNKLDISFAAINPEFRPPQKKSP